MGGWDLQDSSTRANHVQSPPLSGKIYEKLAALMATPFPHLSLHTLFSISRVFVCTLPG